MRIRAAVLLFGPTSIFTFNCGVWQLYRRYWKMNVLETQKNIFQPPQRTLLAEPEGHGEEPPRLRLLPVYTPVELDGYFDMQSVQLVGPRPAPASTTSGNNQKSPTTPSSITERAGGRSTAISGSHWWGESRGGFYLCVPFFSREGPMVMVNLGWVPIDAFKGGVHLDKYLRRTTGKMETLRGIIRNEETKGSWWIRKPEEHMQPVFRAWALFRPYEMAQKYLRKLRDSTGGVVQGSQSASSADGEASLAHHAEANRAENVLFSTQQSKSSGQMESAHPSIVHELTRVEHHPLPHYYVELFEEDITGRVVIHEEVFPKRNFSRDATAAPLHQYYATPMTHVWYAVFWFTCSGMSTYLLIRALRTASTVARMEVVKRANVSKLTDERRAQEAEAAVSGAKEFALRAERAMHIKKE